MATSEIVNNQELVAEASSQVYSDNEKLEVHTGEEKNIEVVEEPKDKKETPATTNNVEDHKLDEASSGDSDKHIGDDFVMIDADPDFKFEKHRASFFAQLEKALILQKDKCDHYKRYFEQQNDSTMAERLAAYSQSTCEDLETLKTLWKNNEILPKYRHETVNLNCLPINTDVKEKELQLTVKASNLPITNNAQFYIIAEFSFPGSKDETLIDSFGRWIDSLKIEPKNLCICSEREPRQLDLIYANPEFVPFVDPEGGQIEFNKPISFFIERGKSRTLKRKFKPIKLTFYEKTNLFRCDKKFGMVQVKIDDINDEISIMTKQPIMNGRKQTEAVAEIGVKVREPLVNKSIRAHEEKLIYLDV